MEKRNLLYVICLSFLLMVTMGIRAQESGPENSYQYAYDKQLEYLNKLANEQGKELYELPECKNFCIWALDWVTKLDENGDLGSFGEAIENYYLSYPDEDGDFELDWQYNSPDELWNDQNNAPITSAGQGLIISLWVNPTDTNHILAGGQFTGGLWKTTDGGDNWFNITEDYREIQGISSIFVNPMDDSSIFITTSFDSERPAGYSNGVYYTHNGGLTWNLENISGLYPNSQQDFSPRFFLQNPQDTAIKYLLTTKRLYVKDSNSNWQIIIDKGTHKYYSSYAAKQFFDDMIFDPGDYNTVYATGPEAYRINYNNGVFDTTNITASLLYTPDSLVAQVIKVDAIASDSNKIWFSLKEKNNQVYVALYDKITTNYTKKPIGLSSISPHYLECEVSPQNPDYIIVGGYAPYCIDFSTNPVLKKAYGNISGFHNDIRATEWPDANFALFGTDGGITKAYHMTPFNNSNYYHKYIANDGDTGIRNIQVRGFDVSRYGKDLLGLGTEHDAFVLKKDGIFHRIFSGGDQESVLIDPINPNNIFSTQFGHAALECTFNMGNSSFEFHNGYPLSTENPPILFFRPNDLRTLYAGYDGVIWEFNTDPLHINDTPITHNLPDDVGGTEGYGFRFIKEVGLSDDLENMFFVSTNRNWMSWLGWDCPAQGGNPHTLALLKVIIDEYGVFNYSDLSANSNLDWGLCGGMITGIAVEVNESDTIVYVSFGGTGDSPDPQKIKKVYYSNDLGINWFAMANGLESKIPVNDIKYHKESGMLFLANDVGVYYYDKADTIWKNITDNLPPMSFDKIRFSFLKNKILVSSFAKGVWEADLPCLYDTIPVTINTSKTWNCSMPIHSDIIIEPYATLTVKKEVYMPTGSKIIVKRKGKLIIDGGKITSACGEMWKGIEVWGDPTLLSVGDYQGMVVVINEGTIENAFVGIQTVKMVEGGGFSNPDLAYAGGIVKIVNAKFINNKTAISYYKYPATGYTHIYSGFNNFSDFETNENYIGSTSPDYFVKMSDINKVKYKVCTFINNNPQHHYGSGIYSMNSQYIMESHEAGSTVENCIFKDLSYGIYGLSTTPNRFPEIIKAEFNNNFKGIYLSGITLAKVWDCDFTMSPNLSAGYGLYLDGCKGYRIEGNSFLQPGINDAVGIIVNETRPTEGELIYRNDFHDIRYGIIAQNRNRNGAGIGLVLKCNEFDNTHWNEVVTCKVPFMTTEYGIASSQGANESAPDAPAGNLFSNTGPTGVATDIYNDANNITYYYHDYPLEALYPEFHTPIKVNPIPVYALWNQFSCPPTNEGSSGGQVPKSELMEDLALSDYKVDSIQGVINILKDGGSTEDLMWEVDMSIPPETYEVYNELMNNSPYISDTVMEAAIEKEAVLPNVMIRDVMVANPHNAKNEELMTKIEERSDPMPEYMKAQILQGRSLVSVFEDLQSEYAFYKQKRKEVYTQLVETYLNDTLNPESALNSLESLLANEHDLSAKYQQAALSVEQGAWDTGLDLINDIPQQFNLTEEEVAENDQIEELYSMMAQLATEGKTMMDASSAQINELVVIEASETGTSSVYSRNILINLAAMEYEEPILLPDAYKVAEVQQEQEVLKQMLAEHHYLKVFPNPAGDYLIIEHNLEMENESAYIEIGNIRGETIRQVQLTGKHNQLTVDIKMLEPGVYISTLFNDKKEIESVKFTKVK